MNERIEQKKNYNNIIYVAIGVLTLMVAVTSATYAYFTATKSLTNTFTGNMATISFDVTVEKKTNVDDTSAVTGGPARGLIPMTNSMVEKAVSNASTKGICVDDNTNAVCQIYKITVVNESTASMFIDGYVTLTGGSGNSTDVTSATTTMRWAQVFCNETSGSLTSCTTAGITTTRATTTAGNTKGIDTNNNWDALGNFDANDDDDKVTEILQTFSDVKTTGKIKGNDYDIIDTNYIRISKHTANAAYAQAADVTSALVYNQYLDPNDKVSGNNTGNSSSTFVDAQVYYIVVWLSETGTNQTANVPEGTNPGANIPQTTSNFFQGSVRFNSAQGSEVTATFTDYLAVTPDTPKNN